MKKQSLKYISFHFTLWWFSCEIYTPFLPFSNEPYAVGPTDIYNVTGLWEAELEELLSSWYGTRNWNAAGSEDCGIIRDRARFVPWVFGMSWERDCVASLLAWGNEMILYISSPRAAIEPTTCTSHTLVHLSSLSLRPAFLAKLFMQHNHNIFLNSNP